MTKDKTVLLIAGGGALLLVVWYLSRSTAAAGTGSSGLSLLNPLGANTAPNPLAQPSWAQSLQNSVTQMLSIGPWDSTAAQNAAQSPFSSFLSSLGLSTTSSPSAFTPSQQDLAGDTPLVSSGYTFQIPDMSIGS